MGVTVGARPILLLRPFPWPLFTQTIGDTWSWCLKAFTFPPKPGSTALGLSALPWSCLTIRVVLNSDENLLTEAQLTEAV